MTGLFLVLFIYELFADKFIVTSLICVIHAYLRDSYNIRNIIVFQIACSIWLWHFLYVEKTYYDVVHVFVALKALYESVVHESILHNRNVAFVGENAEGG